MVWSALNNQEQFMKDKRKEDISNDTSSEIS